MPSRQEASLRRTPRDSVDALLASWRSRRPDLDFEPVSIVARLTRVRAHIDAELDRLFAMHGLSAPGFAVLVTLARVDDGDGVTQRRLMDELGLTSGTISVRMDRLVSAGLVHRRADPGSARSTRISLTDAGRELFERVVPAHLDNERRLLSALAPEEHDLLADLLRKLLVEFEGSRSPSDAAGLGLRLAPAHVAVAMRAAVGLSPVAGLLVRGTDEGGAAERAGLRTGDVLVAAGRRPLRAIADLYAAIDDVGDRGQLVLRFLRGLEEQRTSVAVRAGSAGEGHAAAAPGHGPGGEHRL